MSYSVIFTHGYTRRAENFLKRHPELKSQYEKALNLLVLNPFHLSLHLHKLKGRFERLHSISINISYRITCEFLMRKNTIIPVNIGSHDEACD